MKIQPTTRIVSPILGLAVSTAVGVAIGSHQREGWTRREARTSTACAQVELSANATLPRHNPALYNVPPYASEYVRAIREAGDAGEQMRATLALVNSLPVEDLVMWLEGRWFDNDEGFNLVLFNHALQERLMKEAPDLLFQWASKTNEYHGNKVFKRWADSDPIAALDYLKEHPDATLELITLASLVKTDPALVWERLKDFTGQITYRNSDELKSAIAALPNLTAEQISTLPDGMHTTAKAVLFERSLVSDFDGTFAALADEPNRLFIWQRMNLENDEVRQILLSRMADVPEACRSMLAERSHALINEQNALEWSVADLEGAGFTSSQANQIRSAALSRLPGEKGLAVFDVMDTESAGYTWAVKNFISRNDKNPELIEQLKGKLTNQEELDMVDGLLANREVIRGMRNRLAEDGLSVSDYCDAVIDAATTIEFGKNIYSYNDSDQLISSFKKMTSEQSTEFRKQFANLSQEQKLHAVKSLNGSFHYPQDGFPQDYVRDFIDVLASSSDKNDLRNANEAVVIQSNHRVMADPAQATEWAAGFQDAEMRVQAQRTIAKTWKLHDADAANAWLKTLPTDVQAQINQTP